MKLFIATAISLGIVFGGASTAHADETVAETPAVVAETPAPAPNPGPRPATTKKALKTQYVYWCSRTDYYTDYKYTAYRLSSDGASWTAYRYTKAGKWHHRKATKKDWKRGGIYNICK